MEGIVEDSALFQYRTDSMDNLTKAVTCADCKGKQCCCQKACGIVSGAREVGLLNHGSYNVVEASDVIRGYKVETNENAKTQCAAQVSPKITSSTIDVHKPCCIYVGNTGNKWARTGCNSLEGTSHIKDIVGADCAKCPKVPGPAGDSWCPGADFPTMFWETASYQWAQHIASDHNCGGDVFLLLPEVHDNDGVDKKISTRIELQSYAAMANPPKVTLVTDGTCEDLNGYYCHSPNFQEIVKTLQGHKKIFCLPHWTEAKVQSLVSLHSHSTATAFSCSGGSGHKLAVVKDDDGTSSKHFGWLATLWDIFETLWHWFTGKTRAGTHGKTLVKADKAEALM